jgi:pyruvate/2-oxoglutarate dehydrogenase complex dihydrolipoamide dehydrogenase (E3) component
MCLTLGNGLPGLWRDPWVWLFRRVAAEEIPVVIDTQGDIHVAVDGPRTRGRAGEMRVVVIGGGPAGVSAALHAAELGVEVTLIERGRVGGTAFNSGPAPVRTLARAARLVRDWSSWESFGLRGPRPEVDLAATLANARRVADYLHERKRVGDHIRSVGVDLIEEAGDVRFVDPHTVAAADGRTWTADRVIIAVGGRAGRLPIPGAEFGLTYEDVRSVPALPERVCVIGAADTGCQLTSILADFGCAVTLVEYGPRIVPRADVDVSAALEHAFRGRGIEVITSAAVHQLERLAPGARVRYRVGDDSRAIDVDAAFFAVGWPGNADLVDAAAAGLVTERGYVTVDAFMATNVGHIFAAGDVDGNSMLVSSATLEGRVAADNAVLGPRRRIVHEIVPTGSFTDPEYGSVGLTEEQARARYDCAVAVARYEDMLRPVADGQPEGFCKLIVETAERKIVGAHVFGEYSAEVIQMVAACMAARMRVEDVADLQFAFPTFTEGVSQAAQMVVNQLGIRPMSQLWSSLSSTPSVLE